MSAYLLIKATITQPDKFKQYTQVVPELVAQYGGQYIVMDSNPEQLEGSLTCQSIVISSWPSKEHAKAFWTSDDYQNALQLRAGTGHFDVILLEGLSALSKQVTL